MCNILFLPRGVSLKDEHITNMTLNNPDGLGMLVQDEKGVVKVVAREFREDGIKPERVLALLKKFIHCDRLVHVRYNTVGSSSLENVHPFKVYTSNDRSVYMMHNGTLHDFRPPTDPKNEKFKTYSDSRYFGETFLAKYLKHHTVLGNYEDGISECILDKFIGNTNKVVLWGTGLEPLFLGPWKHMYREKEYAYSTSNDDYFTTVTQSRSIQARKDLANRSSVVPFRGTGWNYRTNTWEGSSRATADGIETYKGFSHTTFEVEGPEVGEDANGFFQTNVLPKESAKLSIGTSSLVSSGKTSEHASYNSFSFKDKSIKEMVHEELIKISKALNSIGPDDLYESDGFGILCTVRKEEWEEVVKQNPLDVPNLLVLLSFATAELQDERDRAIAKNFRQQNHLDEMAKKLGQVAKDAA